MISRERGYLTYPAGAIVTVFAKDIEDDPQLWEAEVDVQFKPVKFLNNILGLFLAMLNSSFVFLFLPPQIQGKRGLISNRDVNEMSIVCETGRLVYAQHVSLVDHNIQVTKSFLKENKCM